MNELVSIVVPVYNMENSLNECVNSLIRQKYENIEIILVDDGSSDNSYEICRKISQTYPKVKSFHTENQGSGPARNYGILQSKGVYLYFPDADDYIEPDAISILIDIINKDKSDLVVFGFKTVDSSGKALKTKRYERSVQDGDNIRADYSEYMGITTKWGIQGAPWNKFFKRSIVEKYKVEYPPLRRHQDEGFICRYMCHVSKVSFIPDILYTYYSNDLKTEWKKYPKDYVESVVGLKRIREETILQWNTKDTKTREIIEREYVNNFIKSLELTFSPKAELKTNRERKEKIRKTIQTYNFRSTKSLTHLAKYQAIVFDMIKKQKFDFVYVILFIKVFAEKLGFLRITKSLISKL